MEFIEKNIKWLVFLFGFLLYANTIAFDYALDDKIVITNNEFTKKGIAGISDLVSNDSMVGFFGRKKNLVSGGRYRPLALVTHAIEWEFFGNNPGVSHFINALLYGLTALVLLLLLQIIFSETKPQFFSISIIATLIYTAHPLHTEVVANIKSRDELLSILFAFLAFWQFLVFHKNNNFIALAISTFCLGLSLFSKESSISFLGIIPVTIYFFDKLNFKKLLIGFTPLLVMAILYLFVRNQVVGGFQTPIANELMNNPFVNASTSQKYGSILLTFLIYFKLLVFPHPLTHDYYPKQIPLVETLEALPMLSILINLFLIGYAIYGLKQKSIWSYLIILYFGSFILYSNIIFPIGTFMNERFLYVSSLSIAIAFAVLILKQFKTKREFVAKLFLAVILIGFSAKTIARNYAWENDETLALTDVETSTNSAKIQMSAGLSYLDLAKEEENPQKKSQYLGKAFGHLKRSLEIYPSYLQPMLLLGNTYSEAKDYKNAVLMYQNVLSLNSDYQFAIQNLEYVGDVNTKENSFEVALLAYETLLKFQPNLVRVYGKVGEIYGKNLNNLPKAEEYLLTAHQIKPDNTDIIQKLGVVFAIQGNTNKALEIFLKGEEIEPENARILINIGLTYNNIGNTQLGNQYLQKAFEIEPSLQRN